MSRASAASIVIVAGMALVASVQAAQPRSVDARTLDIAGVRTGMSYDEALAAAASHFKVAPGQFKPDPLPSENPVTHTKLPDYFTYEQGGMRFAVYFEGRVPVDKRRPLAVSMVRYELPWSQQNSQAMAEAALAKYGVQSNAPNKLPMQWCEKPSPNPGMGCDSDQARLTLSQVKMELIDPAWTYARIRFVEASKTVKPAF